MKRFIEVVRESRARVEPSVRVVASGGTLIETNDDAKQYVVLGEVTTNAGITTSNPLAPDGDDAVSITNNECSDTSVLYGVKATGIIENDFGNGLLFYPNPADSNFSIGLRVNYQTVSITMADFIGKRILSDNDEGSFPEGPAGVYFLTIKSGNKNVVI